MNMEQKHECFSRALTALPRAMTIKDMIIFMHGVCHGYDIDPKIIALGLITTRPETEEEEEEEDRSVPLDTEINFKDERLQQLLGGGAD